jgi:hypothetical protein
VVVGVVVLYVLGEDNIDWYQDILIRFLVEDVFPIQLIDGDIDLE